MKIIFGLNLSSFVDVPIEQKKNSSIVIRNSKFLANGLDTYDQFCSFEFEISDTLSEPNMTLFSDSPNLTKMIR